MTSLDEGYEVSSVFLDISKAFDKVWHKGLLFKLSQNYISGNLLNILSNFLSNRKHGTIVRCRKQIVLSKDKHLCRKTSTRRFLKVPSRTIVIYLMVYLLIQSYLLIIDLYSLWHWHFCSDPGPVLYEGIGAFFGDTFSEKKGILIAFTTLTLWHGAFLWILRNFL